MLFAKKSLDLPTVDTALPGRSIPLPTAETHFINGRPLKGPYPDGLALDRRPWLTPSFILLRGGQEVARVCPHIWG